MTDFQDGPGRNAGAAPDLIAKIVYFPLQPIQGKVQTLAAGATLMAQSTGPAELLTGSAQLSTTGNVSGFVIFRHNGQEAAVPLESRADDLVR